MNGYGEKGLMGRVTPPEGGSGTIQGLARRAFVGTSAGNGYKSRPWLSEPTFRKILYLSGISAIVLLLAILISLLGIVDTRDQADRLRISHEDGLGPRNR